MRRFTAWVHPAAIVGVPPTSPPIKMMVRASLLVLSSFRPKTSRDLAPVLLPDPLPPIPSLEYLPDLLPDLLPDPLSSLLPDPR